MSGSGSHGCWTTTLSSVGPIATAVSVGLNPLCLVSPIATAMAVRSSEMAANISDDETVFFFHPGYYFETQF